MKATVIRVGMDQNNNFSVTNVNFYFRKEDVTAMEIARVESDDKPRMHIRYFGDMIQIVHEKEVADELAEYLSDL